MLIIESGAWRPFTFSFGLIRAPVPRVERALSSRMREVISAQDMDVGDDGPGVVLPMLTRPLGRTLLIRTSFEWTAYFANDPNGGDFGSVSRFLAREARADVLSIGYTPRFERTADTVPFASAVFTYFRHQTSDRKPVRSLAAYQDGRKWYFINEGTPLAGENTAGYEARRVPDRIPPQQLEHLAQCCGATMAESAYHGPARLLQLASSEDPLVTVSLEARRAELKPLA